MMVCRPRHDLRPPCGTYSPRTVGHRGAAFETKFALVCGFGDRCLHFWMRVLFGSFCDFAFIFGCKCHFEAFVIFAFIFGCKCHLEASVMFACIFGGTVSFIKVSAKCH